VKSDTIEFSFKCGFGQSETRDVIDRSFTVTILCVIT